jgi:hypothetical protein
MATVWRDCDEYIGAIRLSITSNPASTVAYALYPKSIVVSDGVGIIDEVRISDFNSLNEPRRFWDQFWQFNGGVLTISGIIIGTTADSQKLAFRKMAFAVTGVPLTSITLTSTATDAQVLVFNDCTCSASDLRASAVNKVPAHAGTVAYTFATIEDGASV